MKSPQISEENRWVINILRNWLKLFTQYPTHIHIILCTNKKTMLFRPSTNSEIIALYKKGISILEISKMLSIGQGEVKLVVDLYNAR